MKYIELGTSYVTAATHITQLQKYSMLWMFRFWAHYDICEFRFGMILGLS